MKALILISLTLCASAVFAQTQPSAPQAGTYPYPPADPNATEKFNRSKCTEPYSEYQEAYREAQKTAKDDSKELRSKITDLKKDQVKAAADIQEKIAEAEKRAKDAEVAFQEAQQEITEALDELEKETNQRATEMVKELQEKINALEENLTTERDIVNNGIQEAKTEGFEACKAQAEDIFNKLMGFNQQVIAAQNKGAKPTGGATLRKESQVKKAKAKAIQHHSTCVTEVTRRLSASRETTMKKLDSAKKRIEQDINIKSVELHRLTNAEYEKQVKSLHEKLRVAGLQLQNAQNSAAQEIARLQQQAQQEEVIANQEITLAENEFSAAKNFDPLKSPDIRAAKSQAFAACCIKAQRNGRETKVPEFPGTVPESFCTNVRTTRPSKTSRGDR